MKWFPYQILGSLTVKNVQIDLQTPSKKDKRRVSDGVIM